MKAGLFLLLNEVKVGEQMSDQLVRLRVYERFLKFPDHRLRKALGTSGMQWFSAENHFSGGKRKRKPASASQDPEKIRQDLLPGQKDQG